MGLLLALVFGIALLGVNSIRALDQSVNQELSVLLESTDLGNGLVSSVASEIRSAEQYLVRPGERLRVATIEEGDSAYALQRRYRGLGSLTTADRYIVNKIAANQAQIEVATAWRTRSPISAGPTRRAASPTGPARRRTPCWATCAPWVWRRRPARWRGRPICTGKRKTAAISFGGCSWHRCSSAPSRRSERSGRSTVRSIVS